MARFGIVMIFVNLFVAGGVLVLASKDYGRYRAQSYAAFRVELVKNGMPVDETEINQEYPDDPTASKLTPVVTSSIFEGKNGGPELGGAPVTTVLQEVDRVWGKIEGVIGALGDDAQKRVKLWEYLEFQARTMSEREAYKKKCSEGAAQPALEELKLRFTYIRTPQGRSDKPNHKEIRLAAAVVLVNLATDAAWRERVATVVGLEAYVQAMGMQADSFAKIVSDYKSLIALENGNFEVAYANAVRELQYHSEELFQARKRLAQLTAVAGERQDEVNKRKTEVQNHEQELAAKTAAYNAENGRLEAIQRELFFYQQQLGLARDETEKLEEKLRNKARAQP
jgi:hypothetical protein